MSKNVKETFKQSVLVLLVSQVLVKVLGMVYRLYLTNRSGYGDEGNAISSAAFQVYSLILSITAIGVPGAISRLVAERDSKGDHQGAYKIFKISLLIFSIIGIIGTYLLTIMARKISNSYLNIPEAELSIIALAPSIFLVSVISVFKGYFAGIERLKETAKAQSLDQITKTFCTFMFIETSVIMAQSTNTKVMAACTNLATTIANIIELLCLYKSFLNIRRDITYQSRNSINTREIRALNVACEILAVAVPISLSALIGTIAKNIDSTTIVNGLKDIIGYEQAKKEYGILSGKVETLISFPLSFSGAITMALLPTIAAAKDRIKSKEGVINKSILFGTIITMPAIALFMVFGDEILALLFPNASSGGMILKVSSISIIFIAMEQTLDNILYGIGKSYIPIISVIIGVTVKFIFNKILVPRVDLFCGGTVGAAYATAFYNLVTLIINYIAIKRYTNIKFKISSITKPLIASTAMIVIAKIIYNIIVNTMQVQLSLIISLGIGSLIYIVMLFLTKSLRIGDINFIKIKGSKCQKNIESKTSKTQ